MVRARSEVAPGDAMLLRLTDTKSLETQTPYFTFPSIFE